MIIFSAFYIISSHDLYEEVILELTSRQLNNIRDNEEESLFR